MISHNGSIHSVVLLLDLLEKINERQVWLAVPVGKIQKDSDLLVIPPHQLKKAHCIGIDPKLAIRIMRYQIKEHSMIDEVVKEDWKKIQDLCYSNLKYADSYGVLEYSEKQKVDRVLEIQQVYERELGL